MSSIRSRNNTVKLFASLGMIVFMAFFSACDILASEGAREAIANGREVRALEDAELRPLEREMDDLYVNEIQPRESQLEDLRYEMQSLEEDLLRPLWDSQNDAWAPGGEASDLQLAFDVRYRELDLLQRAIDVEQRELDANWQNLWGTGSDFNTEFQALEDLRFEKQRELDHLYRFGYREIDDIWDQINELNSGHNWANTDSQIKSEELNNELRRLYDLYEEIQNSGNHDSSQIEEKARFLQDQLNDLYSFGWDPINEIYAEIERLQLDQSLTFTSIGNSEYIAAQIAELYELVASYEASRDAELAALHAELDAAASDVDQGDGDTTARIAELEQLIDDLENQVVEIFASRTAGIDSLNDQIADESVSYGSLIDEAIASFVLVSNDLLENIANLDGQIDELTELGGDDAAVQIAILQPQRDGLAALEEAEEAGLHDLITQYETERDAGIAELQAAIEAIEADGVDGVTNDIDFQITEYVVELDALRTGDGSDGTNLLASLTSSTAEILESIEAAESYWNELIGDVLNKIGSLEAQLVSGGTTNDAAASRIHSLSLQANELENDLNARISNLEASVNDLYNQAGSTYSGDSGRLAEVQSQIDSLNKKLEAIWHRDSTSGLDNLRVVQELEKRARVLDEELEHKTRALEEVLWELDDRLSLFYKDQESENRTRQAGFEAEMAALQQRRFDLEEQRWDLDAEQQIAFHEIEKNITSSVEEIRRIEDEEFSVIRSQIRELELELRTFYDRQQEIEVAMREAQRLIEEKKRELEDNVFDLLEDAAGTNDDIGDPVPDTTIGGIIPEIGDATEEPGATTN